MKTASNRVFIFVFIACFIIFGALGMAYSGPDMNAVQQQLRAYYTNFVEASTKFGAESAEARAWFEKYKNLASEYSRKLGEDAPIATEASSSSQAAGSSSSTPGFFKKVTYQFLEKLKMLLNDEVPSHVNDFALGEMNFVSGNYKDALTLYEMAQRKGELSGIYFYQSIYWQGRCYLEMAKTAPTRAQKIELYKKAQQKYLNVSMNLLGRKNLNSQEQMYLKDSTSLVIQINKHLAYLNANANPGQTTVNNTNINSGFEDNSWKTTLRYDYLVSDSAYVDVNSMNRAQIQSFLESKNSVLSRPVDGKYPADMIYAAAKEFGISPKVILARLQTEQSLVTVKTATQKQLDWALGCGAYDSGNWNSKYKGLENQIRFGAKTMRTHYNKGLTMIAQNGSINKTIDGENINIKNAATYANYMYTPHKHGGKLFRSCYLTFFK